MTALEIRIELLKKGTSMWAIARKMDVSPQAVYQVVQRKLVSRRIMAALAEALGLTVRQVFPEYEPKYKPRRQTNTH